MKSAFFLGDLLEFIEPLQFLVELLSLQEMLVRFVRYEELSILEHDMRSLQLCKTVGTTLWATFPGHAVLKVAICLPVFLRLLVLHL